MKTLVKLVLALVLFAVCVPAQGEILIYSKTYRCWEASEVFDDGVDWIVDEWTQRAFLVLDVDYDEGGEIDDIDGAEQIEYEKDVREKWYWQIKEDFMIERIEVDGEVIWVIEELQGDFEPDWVDIMMVRGRAREMNIGLGRDDKKEVARVLNGYIMYLSLGMGIEKAMCTMSLRLQSRWTRLANDPEECEESFDCAVYGIVKDWLERRGYREEF